MVLPWFWDENSFTLENSMNPANHRINKYLFDCQLASFVDDFIFHLPECRHAFQILWLLFSW